MKNKLKRLSALFIVAVLVMLLIPVTAKADDTYTIYARVPSNWGVPNMWAWTDDGVNVFEEWPGAAMTETGDGEWYQIELPISATNVIVNYGGDANKTADISLDGTDVWITVCQDNTYIVDYTKPDGEAPDTSGTDTDVDSGEMINLMITVPADWTYPYLWAWSDSNGDVYDKWPGEEIVIQENGVGVKQIPNWVTGIIVSAQGGVVQTEDITIESGKDTNVIIYSADDYLVTYVENEEQETETVDKNTMPDPNNSGNNSQSNSDSSNNNSNNNNNNSNNNNNNNGNNDNSNNDSGFFKILIPAVCVIVVVVVIVASKKSKEDVQ